MKIEQRIFYYNFNWPMLYLADKLLHFSTLGLSWVMNRDNFLLYTAVIFLLFKNDKSVGLLKYRTNRSIQVKGAFGVLKNDYGFQRFLLRDKKKVKLEILLLSRGYNLNKLRRKIQNERTGNYLFDLKESA